MGPTRYSRRDPTERGARAIAFRGSLALLAYPVGGRPSRALAVRESRPPEAPKPRLPDRVRAAIRGRHYSLRTEKAYVHWIRRFIVFHGKRHPAEMGAAEVTKFLTSLAVDGHVAASTQNQALSALLFLYKDVLEVDLPWLDGVVRAKRPVRLPVVLTRDEVRAVLQRLEDVPRLMSCLLYGAGLRVLECCRLRVQDVDFATSQITVRGGKGDKDRVTMLPAMAKPDLVRVRSRWVDRILSVIIVPPCRWLGLNNDPEELDHQLPAALPSLHGQSCLSIGHGKEQLTLAVGLRCPLAHRSLLGFVLRKRPPEPQ
ncbi:MAG: phage integrase N-terminal SAM-like domain-containing protein [Candidatus Rokubacteria bacterium]|nr:phage integrase N-terminal SAM-like domain-containing protein [Candidatus Rokubacteria bacterium]MBI3109018.1 phage integrase N-terminal SAM-like domain-containing protein [Candidatus Rokubacteria bacterium]